MRASWPPRCPGDSGGAPWEPLAQPATFPDGLGSGELLGITRYRGVRPAPTSWDLACNDSREMMRAKTLIPAALLAGGCVLVLTVIASAVTARASGCSRATLQPRATTLVRVCHITPVPSAC